MRRRCRLASDPDALQCGVDEDFFEAAAAKVLSVGELTRNIRGLLEARYRAVWVQGEISNCKKYASGHQYFTLKDRRAAISCVIFRSAAIATPLADGAQVQIFGSVTVFEARGQYQLNVEIVQPRGLGLLQAKFEALKRKLEAEGLFAAERKKALPKFPRRIGIVTSPSGAVIRDMLNVLARRAPGLAILVNPVRVQGTGAATEIAAAIHELNLHSLDLIVVARGGGSIEDLWEFNEEIVARAIAASALPVVSAVGHEIDFTIADFVADLRAPTPSAAAELIVPDAAELTRRLAELNNSLQRSLRNFLAENRARLRNASERALARELVNRINGAKQEIDWLRENLVRTLWKAQQSARQRFLQTAGALRVHTPRHEIEHIRGEFAQIERRLAESGARRLATAREGIRHYEKILGALAPAATLRRGFSITRNAEGKVLRSVEEAGAPGTRLLTQLSDGELLSETVFAPVRSPRS